MDGTGKRCMPATMLIVYNKLSAWKARLTSDGRTEMTPRLRLSTLADKPPSPPARCHVGMERWKSKKWRWKTWAAGMMATRLHFKRHGVPEYLPKRGDVPGTSYAAHYDLQPSPLLHQHPPWSRLAGHRICCSFHVPQSAFPRVLLYSIHSSTSGGKAVGRCRKGPLFSPFLGELMESCCIVKTTVPALQVRIKGGDVAKTKATTAIKFGVVSAAVAGQQQDYCCASATTVESNHQVAPRSSHYLYNHQPTD